MSLVTKVDSIPENSIILKNFRKVDYCDSYQISKKTNDTIDSIVTEIFKIPLWVDYLMIIRNQFVEMFGLKTDSKKAASIDTFYPIGSKAVYFTVVDRNDNEIIMAENDKHLNFRTSVFIDRNNGPSKIYLSTVVTFNNVWGRLYFLPVRPFHQIIVRSLLKRHIK